MKILYLTEYSSGFLVDLVSMILCIFNQESYFIKHVAVDYRNNVGNDSSRWTISIFLLLSFCHFQWFIRMTIQTKLTANFLYFLLFILADWICRYVIAFVLLFFLALTTWKWAYDKILTYGKPSNCFSVWLLPCPLLVLDA